MVGDLNYEILFEVVKGLLVVGVDIIEFGLFFIDLMVDGLII